MNVNALSAVATLASLALVLTAPAQGTAFSYQGMLHDNGAPASGVYDLRFTLFNVAVDGLPLTTSVVVDDLSISNGMFATTLDFGAGLFDGPARWIEVAVRPGDSVSDFTTLTPRQSVLPTPYAIYAAGVNGAGIAGTIPAGSLPAASVDENILATNVGVWTKAGPVISYAGGNVGIGAADPATELDVRGTVTAYAFAGDGSGLTNLSPLAVSNALSAAATKNRTTETINPMQAALMKWYVGSGTKVTVGVSPRALVFDGTCLWVGNSGDGTVTRVRTSDGIALGTYGVGRQPGSMAFDGANVWVVNELDHTVTKLRTLDGTYAHGSVEASTFWADVCPRAITFDGANLWVSALGQDGGSLTELKASDGSFSGGNLYSSSFWLNGGTPKASAFDGVHLWVATENLWNGTDYFDGVLKVNVTDGSVVVMYPACPSPASMVFDGANLWISSAQNGTVTKLRTSDGETVGTYSVGSNPGCMTFDGNHVWVVNRGDATVTKIHVIDGTYENGTRENSTYPAGLSPQGIAFDGVNVWVADAGDNSVNKL